MTARPIGITVTTDLDVATAEARVREALAAEGFGVLTEIDVQATLREKLGVERAPYKILGACNPPLAHRALELDPEIGLLLPCNVVVREDESGDTVVSAFEPLAMAEGFGRSDLLPVAEEARERLQRALATLE